MASMGGVVHVTVYILTFVGLNFHRSRVSRFCVFIFPVYDVTADLLPIWSKFSQDETFEDDY